MTPSPGSSSQPFACGVVCPGVVPRLCVCGSEAGPADMHKALQGLTAWQGQAPHSTDRTFWKATSHCMQSVLSYFGMCAAQIGKGRSKVRSAYDITDTL